MSSQNEPKKPDATTEPKQTEEVEKDGEIAESHLEKVGGAGIMLSLAGCTGDCNIIGGANAMTGGGGGGGG